MASQAQHHAQAMARQLQEQSHALLHKLHHHKPTSSQLLGFLSILLGVALFAVAAFLAVTTIALLAPLFIFLCPVLVPAGIVLFLGAAVALVAGGLGIAGLSAVSWIYHYSKGRHPPGSDQLDHACQRFQELRRKLAGTFLSSTKPQLGAAEAAAGA